MSDYQPLPPSPFGPDSDLEEDEHEQVLAEQPFKLKEEGNRKFVEKNYQAAVTLWMQSVKETLKRSVRTPSTRLYENQVTCRLNMSMAYLKMGEWLEAKSQAEMVLEQRPTNLKALYRLASALEKLQDWTSCENAMQLLLDEADKATGHQNGKTDEHSHQSEEASNLEKEDQSKEQSNIRTHQFNTPPQDDNVAESDLSERKNTSEGPINGSSKVVLDGFTPSELRHLVASMKKRIAQDKAVYKQKSKKVFGRIGAHLDEIGASEGREEIPSPSIPDEPDMDDVSQDKQMEDIFGTDLTNIVRWRHQHPDDIEEEKKETNTDDKPNQAEMLASTATPILKECCDLTADSDDPNGPIWSIANTVQSFKQDKRVLTLSLPFTLTRVIERITAPQKLVKEEDEVVSPTPPSSIFDSSYLQDDSKRARLQRRLLRSIQRSRHLTVHLIGVRGDVEMECQWTSVLKRIPKLRTLQIICVGFQDNDDRWSRSLSEGVTSPPLTKSQGLSGGKKLTCRLFKGLYQLFLKEYPDVLTRRSHPFHPDLVMIAEPRLSRFFDPWFPVLHTLVEHEVPTILTGHSAVDLQSHEAETLPHVMRSLSAAWALPMQPNVYSVKIQPEPECPPMELWTPAGEEPLEFQGVSAKNAVFGVFFGSSGPVPPLSDVEQIKSKLQAVCDIDSEVVPAACKLPTPAISELPTPQTGSPSAKEVTDNECYDNVKEKRRLD